MGLCLGAKVLCSPNRGASKLGYGSIAQRGAAATSETAEALWVGCRPTLASRPPPTAKVVPLGGDRFQLVLEPGIGRLGAHRLTGCLSDVTLDYVRADVVDVENTSPPSG
jgi:hypothetical protein